MFSTKQPVVAPLPPALREARAAASLRQRAGLEGVEVTEVSLSEWLAAGGDRRKTSRLDQLDAGSLR